MSPIEVSVTAASAAGAPPMLGNLDRALRRAWHPVARSSEIAGTVPHHIRLLGEHWALWRAPEGLAAFVDRCPHRSAPLTIGSVDECGGVTCAYHGWRFGPDGDCSAIPALGHDAALPGRARLTPAAGVAEVGGLVWLAPESPLTDLPVIDPDLDPDIAAGVAVGMLEPATARVCAGSLLDNFCDIAHFPFVHAGTFGLGESPRVGPMETLLGSWRVGLIDEHEFNHQEDPGVAAGIRPLLQRRRATYTYLAPFTGLLRLDYLDAGGTNLILFAAQPLTADECRVYTVLFRNDLPQGEMPAAIAYEQRVLEEDLLVQTRLARAFPLDVLAEVHTRADRLTLEIRRMLRQFSEEATADAHL